MKVEEAGEVASAETERGTYVRAADGSGEILADITGDAADEGEIAACQICLRRFGCGGGKQRQ